VDRRVYGKFVVSDGLKYPTFNRKKHVIPYHPINVKSGSIYAGVDPGSGGDNHPSAICFVWVNDEFTQARVFKGWRGDGIVTTASDLLDKFRQMKRGLPMTAQYYDYICRDFFTIATRIGEPFQPADKDRKKGDEIINTLFKTNSLKIYDLTELEALVYELTSLQSTDIKRHAKDDFIDAMRYALSKIPFDWEKITDLPPEDDPKATRADKIVDLRRNPPDDLFIPENELEAEFAFWNDYYES